MRFLLHMLFGLTLMSGGAMVWGQATPTPPTVAGIFTDFKDVGVTPKAGSVHYDKDSGEYHVTGGGANVWGTQDAFAFLYQKITGDFSLTADVRFEGKGAVAHRKAMLMARQDVTPGSPYADAALHGDGLTSLQYRPAADAATLELRSTITAPSHLRLERHGNDFTIRVGPDGMATGPQTVTMSGPVFVGLAVCSHDANVLETAVFSNVRLELGPPPPPAPSPSAAAPPKKYRSKITIYNLATKLNRTVYTGDGVIEAPNWSRDGSFLMVNSNGSLQKIALNEPTPPKLEPITLSIPGLRCNNDHDLTRDGKKIALSASSPQSRQSQVYVANADGSGATLLTPKSPSYFHGWSPEGDWLAFVGQRNGQYHLFRVPVTGGDEQQLTSAGTYDDGPEYSRDGQYIYFNSNRSGSWDVWRIPADGGGPNDAKAERVTSDEWEDWFPHFSPDGKMMLVFSFPKGTAGHNDRLDGVTLRIAPAPGKTLPTGGVKPEILNTFFGGQGTINVNSWSPDSKQFAYVVYEVLPQ